MNSPSTPFARWLSLTFLALLLSTTIGTASAATSALSFRGAMRKLWEDHVTWTRLYIVEMAADLPGKDATAQRLLQNQTDIGSAIKPYYGAEAGDKLTALLKDHIMGAVEVLAAAKAADSVKLGAANAKWYANGDEIAAFLSTANPSSWPLDATKAEMKMHLDVTLEEATAQLKGDWAASVRAYDKVHQHILGLADTLSTGIMTQFPAQFDQTGLVAEFPLRGAMRKLWEDHITWTRLYIVEMAADQPGKDATAQRLLQNQTDIGNAIKPYYGAEAGDKLTALLKDHIMGAVEVLAAAKAADTAKLEAANAKWYANGDEIATFLSTANPANWPLDATKAEMKMHLDVTLEEATAQLKGNWTASVQAYDKVHEHILGLADTLSTGILRQAPRAAAMPAALPKTGGGPGQGSGEGWPLLLVAALLLFSGTLRFQGRAGAR